jgi:putative PIN family toxin of toxin-antitoxin system
VRAVFDTNVLVAAFISEGLCARLLSRARRRHFELFLCPNILEEFQTVLRRKFKASPEEIEQAVALMGEATQEMVEAPSEAPRICRDPDDDRILACASAAAADCLVTGDDDLLVLKKHGKIRILTPREFELIFAD